jgi:hypothetical protein
MEVIINNITYKIKYSIRALMVYEQLTDRPFKGENITELYVFFYALIIANNPDSILLFNDFIDFCDDNPDIAFEIQKYISDEILKQNQFIQSKKK